MKHNTAHGEVDVYPVGLLDDLRRFRGAVKHQPKPWNRRGPHGHPWWRLLHDLRCGIVDRARRREWRTLKNYFNGFLAEPADDGTWTRCGHGWTQRRALADLARHRADVAKRRAG